MTQLVEKKSDSIFSLAITIFLTGIIWFLLFYSINKYESPFEIPILLIFGIFLAVLITFIGNLFLITGPGNFYEFEGNSFWYIPRDINLVIDRDSYIMEIKIDEIEKVIKYPHKNGQPILLKVLTKNKIHYISGKDATIDFLFELKNKGLQDLIIEKKKNHSVIGYFLLWVKGGKVEERK